jgi:Family of unknown function (DUF5519)
MPVRNAQEIVSEVSSWEGVSSKPHRFSGVELRFGSREIGHIHGDYQTDIPFPKSVRDKLVSEKRAEPHHILPSSGWITFPFVKKEDVEKAIGLFRLSYDFARNSGKQKDPIDLGIA